MSVVDHTPLAADDRATLRAALAEAQHDVQMLGYESGALREEYEQLCEQLDRARAVVADAWNAMPPGVRQAADQDGASLAAAVQAMTHVLQVAYPGWPGNHTEEHS